MTPEAGPADAEGGAPPGWQQVDTLGLAEIVMAILEGRPGVPSATAAAVRREQRGDVIHVRVSLLTEPPGEPATGADRPGGSGVVVAEFGARRLGRDLSDAFEDNEVIILRLPGVPPRRRGVRMSHP